MANWARSGAVYRRAESVARSARRIRRTCDAQRHRAQCLRKGRVGVLRSLARPTRRLWPAVALLLIANGLLGAAAPVSEYQLKAVFLFNFAQFVEWPPAGLHRERGPCGRGR